jgi:hypothetical protein
MTLPRFVVTPNSETIFDNDLMVGIDAQPLYRGHKFLITPSEKLAYMLDICDALNKTPPIDRGMAPQWPRRIT